MRRSTIVVANDRRYRVGLSVALKGVKGPRWTIETITPGPKPGTLTLVAVQDGATRNQRRLRRREAR